MQEQNPLRHGRRLARSTEPCVMVIFGGSGDLTRRKIIPALYSLSAKRFIPAGFTILALSRTPMNDDEYRARLKKALEESGAAPEPSTWESFAQGIHYVAADYHAPEAHQNLREALAGFDARRGTSGNRIFYLATPPSDYMGIIQNLGAAGLARESQDQGPWVRIIIEKPFGRDLQSARELNRTVAAEFQEDQVYRIDHYLGKETVQNILVLRFANCIFEPIWNRRYIDNIQITAAENIGIGTRGNYYEEAGALRDMIQNHVLQLLALVAMEPPPDFMPNSVRDEKAKVLRSIRPVSMDEAGRVSARGQYGPGFILGKPASGYRDEKDVSPHSNIETYAAIRFTIDNWRWADVPFYVRTGKNLAKQVTEIAVLFRRTPHFIFRQSAIQAQDSNVLALRIQPNEGITLRFDAKMPGQAMNIQPVHMDFRYGSTFGTHLASAYERLLLDCMLGDLTLFNRADSVETAWALVEPILDAWSKAGPIPIYPSGSWGPAAADALLEREHRRWRLL